MSACPRLPNLKGNLTETTGALSRNYDYDAHNQLLKATGFGEETSYRYDANNSRYFKRDLSSGETTLYLGDRFELIVKGHEKSSKFRLTDNIIITRNKFNVIKRNYLQKDRLGSVSRILDENGTQLHVKGYDAFGKPRDGETWLAEPQLDFTDSNASGIDITKRGFTEHEHLDNFELIHMNGRMYDFNNGRFLSVDPFIQGTDSQAINPYSYIQNNPLSGVDPTGYYRIPDNCSAADMNCSKANYTIKQMQDDMSGQTDNGHDNRFQLQNAGANKIGNSMTLADLESQVGTVNLLPIDLEPTREKILDGDFVVGEKFNFPWSEYDEQHIRAELYQEYRLQMSDAEYKKTIGSAIDALSVNIKLAEFHNSASQNNIHGLGLFNIGGEFQVSDASYVTYNNRTIQNTPGKLQFFLEHQISIYNGRENDMVGLFYMRGRVNQIMGRYSKEFQGIADDTGVPVIFTDNNPAPYRDSLTPSSDRVGSTYLWLPNYKIQFKDDQ